MLNIALHLRLLPAGATAEHLHAALRDHYTGQAFVELQDLVKDVEADGLRLDPRALNDSNRLRLGVFQNERNGQVLLSAVYDNLGKGAAGAALQNLDLMLARGAGAQSQGSFLRNQVD